MFGLITKFKTVPNQRCRPCSRPSPRSPLDCGVWRAVRDGARGRARSRGGMSHALADQNGDSDQKLALAVRTLAAGECVVMFDTALWFCDPRAGSSCARSSIRRRLRGVAPTSTKCWSRTHNVRSKLRGSVRCCLAFGAAGSWSATQAPARRSCGVQHSRDDGRATRRHTGRETGRAGAPSCSSTCAICRTRSS